MPQETEITVWVYQNEPAALRSGRVAVRPRPAAAAAATATKATLATDAAPLSNYNPTPSTPAWCTVNSHHGGFSRLHHVGVWDSSSGISRLLTEGPRVTSGRGSRSESGRDLDGEMRGW